MSDQEPSPDEWHSPAADTPARAMTRGQRQALGAAAPPLHSGLTSGREADEPAGVSLTVLVQHLQQHPHSPQNNDRLIEAYLNTVSRPASRRQTAEGGESPARPPAALARFREARLYAQLRRSQSSRSSGSSSDGSDTGATFRVNMISTPSAVGFENLAPISGEDAEELADWFKALEYMITLRASHDKLKHFNAELMGQLMMGKLHEHSKAHDLLEKLLTDAYHERWDNWRGKDAPVDDTPAAEAGEGEAPPAVKPLATRMRAMVADVREHLTQRLGHKADHKKKAEEYEGRDPRTGQIYATPTLVVARAKVLYDLAIKAGVQNLPGPHYAWKIVNLLGKIFPVYDTSLGNMIRNHVMSTSVDADALTLDEVATLADKFYTTWRTYDSSYESSSGKPAKAMAKVNSLQEPRPPAPTKGGQQYGSCNTCGSTYHSARECFKANAGLMPSYIPSMTSEDCEAMYKLWAASYERDLGYRPPLFKVKGREAIVQWMKDTVPAHLLNGLQPGEFRRSSTNNADGGGRGGRREGGGGRSGGRHSDNRGRGGGRGGQQQQQPRVNLVNNWDPTTGGPPSEAGTTLSVAELRSQILGDVRNDLRAMLLELGLGSSAPAVNMVQQQAAPAHTAPNPQAAAQPQPGPPSVPRFHVSMLRMEEAHEQSQADRVHMHVLQQAAEQRAACTTRSHREPRQPSSLLVGFQPKPEPMAEAREEQARYIPPPPAPTPLQKILETLSTQLQGCSEQALRASRLASGKPVNAQTSQPSTASPGADVTRIAQELARLAAQLTSEQPATVASVQRGPPASTETPVPEHMAGKRVALAYLSQLAPASGLTLYDKSGAPYLPNLTLLDCGAECNCIAHSVGLNCPRPIEPCRLKVKAFGEMEVHVIGKIRDFPMTFCKGTAHEITVYLPKVYVFKDTPSWKVLLAQPSLQHHNLCLWVCGFLSAVVMWPQLHRADPDAIWQLPEAERSKVLGDMVLLPCRMLAPEWKDMDMVRMPAPAASVNKITASLPDHGEDSAEEAYYSEEDNSEQPPVNPDPWTAGHSYAPWSREPWREARSSRQWPMDGRAVLQFTLEGDSQLPDPRSLPPTFYYGDHWELLATNTALDYVTACYFPALAWYQRLHREEQQRHMAHCPAGDGTLSLWNFDGHQTSSVSWTCIGTQTVRPDDLSLRYQVPSTPGGQHFCLYAETLQAHQLRVIIAYCRRDDATPPTGLARSFSTAPHAPHLAFSFRREQWRHERGISGENLPPHPQRKCTFIAAAQGGWPDVGDLPERLRVPTQTRAQAQWRECVSPNVEAELQDLYAAGRKVLLESGQAFYEHHGFTCWPTNDNEVWTYSSITGMTVLSHEGNNGLDLATVSAQHERSCEIGATLRAQLLVIKVVTDNYGLGPRRFDRPPPTGSLVTRQCYTRADNPIRARADWPALLLQDF